MHLLEEDCILHEPGPFSDVMDVGDSCVARSRATRSLDPPAWWKRCFCWASRYSCSARKPIGLTRAPMGYSRTLPADGGTVSPPPLLSAKPLDRFSIRKLQLIAPGLNFPNILQDFMSLMTSQIGSKVKLWLSALADFAGAMPKWNKSMERHGPCLGYF